MNPDAPKPAEPSRINPKSPFPLIAGLLTAIMGIIWLAAAMDRVVMPLVTLAGVEQIVLDLRLLPYEKADSLCRAAGLVLEKIRGRPDSRAATGSILDQFPGAGVPVKPGKKIEVVVCDSIGPANTPNVIGRSPREAALSASQAGLIVNEEHIRRVTSWEYPAGVVIRQSPKPEELVTPNSELLLTVSLGPPPDRVIVPNLVGMPYRGVSALLERTGLRLGGEAPGAASDSTVIVTAQQPAAGSNVSVGSAVTVQVGGRQGIKPAAEIVTPNGEEEN